ncbi:MAG TPA: 6-carboxytetrahydropterin synthase [Thermoanaerobaculia bacterium]|nr:6-carboxytetrahydropterin synthase [Thermoanaerobaculia bacterium]
MSSQPSEPRFRIVLEKEDFKFSAAHFTLFSDGGAELLHGHNYRVRAELAGSDLDEEGLLVDIERFKKALRERCANLDSRTLLPAASGRVQWSRDGDAIEVVCGERRYRFPADDVLLLPLVNTSMELIARMLWEDLAPALKGSRVQDLAVSVEESSGQRCWYERGLVWAWGRR